MIDSREGRRGSKKQQRQTQNSWASEQRRRTTDRCIDFIPLCYLTPRSDQLIVFEDCCTEHLGARLLVLVTLYLTDCQRDMHNSILAESGGQLAGTKLTLIYPSDLTKSFSSLRCIQYRRKQRAFLLLFLEKEVAGRKGRLGNPEAYVCMITNIGYCKTIDIYVDGC